MSFGAGANQHLEQLTHQQTLGECSQLEARRYMVNVGAGPDQRAANHRTV
jgi:hypothetical protein